MPLTLGQIQRDEALRRAGFVVERALPGAAEPDAEPARFVARHPVFGEGLLELQPGPAPPAARARRLLALSHRHLLRVLQAGALSEGTPFVVCTAPGGPSLAELVRDGPLPCDVALSVLRQVAAGLAAAHQAGLGHGRVHAGNVFERGDGQVVLGPPRLVAAERGLAAEVGADLRHLGALFGELVHAAALPAGELGDVLRRLRGPEAPAPRGTFELYATIEAAARKDGLIEEFDSAVITLPGGPAAPDSVAEAQAGFDVEDATLEMEQLDPGELADLLPPSPSLQDLVGPLERRPPAEMADMATMPVRRLAPEPARREGPASAEETPARPRRLLLLNGPARWLVPLGLAAAVSLALAAWVLLRGP